MDSGSNPRKYRIQTIDPWGKWSTLTIHTFDHLDKAIEKAKELYEPKGVKWRIVDIEGVVVYESNPTSNPDLSKECSSCKIILNALQQEQNLDVLVALGILAIIPVSIGIIYALSFLVPQQP